MQKPTEAGVFVLTLLREFQGSSNFIIEKLEENGYKGDFTELLIFLERHEFIKETYNGTTGISIYCLKKRGQTFLSSFEDISLVEKMAHLQKG